MKNNLFKNIARIGTCLLIGTGTLSAQTSAQNAGSSYFTNSIFLTLAAIIILLLVVIVVLSYSIRNGADYLKEIVRKSSANKGLAIAAFLLSAHLLSANTNAASVSGIGGLDSATFYLMVLLIIVEIVVIYILGNILSRMFGIGIDAKTAGIKLKEDKRTISDLFNASVEVEREAEIMLDHEYDGIRELDNNLPPWWKYGFYLTIVWAVVYLFYYHMGKSGDLQEAEYKKEVAVAEAQIAEFRKKADNNVDETNVKLITTPAEMENAKKIYVDNCAACHGRAGEGGVGPNMADQYWLHGGSLSDIFKSIKYGWSDKGMKAWKEDLSPNQIALLSSYIKSIAGTNPANGKAPQGELYQEGAVTSDSTLVTKPDSLQAAVADTLKK